MAKYAIGARGLAVTAAADGTTLVDNNYHALRVVTVNRVARIEEVYIAGEAGASTVVRMVMRRHATNAAPGGGDTVPNPMNPISAAADSRGFISTATTDPALAAAPSDILNLALNIFGGIVRWQAGPEEFLYIVSTATPNAQVSLSSVSGSGTITDHMIFEEM